jgi:hypothetical protein
MEEPRSLRIKIWHRAEIDGQRRSNLAIREWADPTTLTVQTHPLGRGVAALAERPLVWLVGRNRFDEQE